MKHKYNYLSLLGILLLTSCANGGSTASTAATGTNKVSTNTNISWNEVYAHNAEEEDTKTTTTKKETTKLADMSADSSYEYDTTYVKYGLLIAKSESKTIFYSLIFGAPLFSTPFDNNLLTYEVNSRLNGSSEYTTSASIGFILRVTYGTSTYVVDPFGRTLISSVYDGETGKYVTQSYDSSPSLSSSYTYVNAVAESSNGYAIVKTYINGYYCNYDSYYSELNATYYYASDGSLRKISSTDDLPPVEEESSSSTSSPFETSFGEMMKDGEAIDLSEYGLPGYSLSFSYSGYCTVFSATGEVVNSFYIPYSSSSLSGVGFVGNKIFYQTVECVSRNSGYGYYDYGASLDYNVLDSNGDKYQLVTHYLNILTGETGTIDFPYVIENAAPYKDENGIYNYLLMSVTPINGNKQMSEVSSMQVITDSSLNFLKEVSGEYVSSFVRLDDEHYYNTSNKIIYDASFKPLLYIASMSPTLDRKNECFEGSINGRYGAIDYSGKVILEFTYSELLGIDEGKALVKYGDTYCRVDLTTGVRSFLGYNKSSVGTGLYLFENNEGFLISSVKEDLVSKKYDTDEDGELIKTVTPYTLSTTFQKGSYAFVTYNGTIYRFANNAYEGEVKLTTNNDIDFSKHLSTDPEDAMSLKEGENYIFLNGKEAYFSIQETAGYLYQLSYSSSYTVEPETLVNNYKDSSTNWNYYASSSYFYRKASKTGDFVFSVLDSSYYSGSLFNVENAKLTLTSFAPGEHTLNKEKLTVGQKTTFSSSLDKKHYFTFTAPSSTNTTDKYTISIDSDYSFTLPSTFNKIDGNTYTISLSPASTYDFEIYSNAVSDTSISLTINKTESI